MTNSRTTYTATYLYPGAFMPESTALEVSAPTLAAAIAAQSDSGWYAVTINAKSEKRFVSDDGEVAWVRQSDEKVASWIVGEAIHYEDPRLEGDRYDILRSNIQCNSREPREGYGVLTRCGNWQLASDFGEVVDPALVSA